MEGHLSQEPAGATKQDPMSKNKNLNNVPHFMVCNLIFIQQKSRRAILIIMFTKVIQKYKMFVK